MSRLANIIKDDLNGSRIYNRKSFRKIPPDMLRMLRSLKEYKSGYEREAFSHARDHRQIARILKQGDCSPFTIIIIAEMLDPSHYWDKRFVKIKVERLLSELDETVLRHFEREINYRMSKFLEQGSDTENRYFRKLLREFYPQAKRLLRNEYRDIYPRAWKKKFTLENISKPRKKRRSERIYAMPEPLNYWDSRNSYQQYFAVPEYNVLWQGGSGSSGQRETQSRSGFAFALLNRKKAILSRIFIYDKDNIMRYVDTIEGLCLAPHDMGSNYHLDIKEMRNLLRDTFRVEHGSVVEPVRTITIRPFY